MTDKPDSIQKVLEDCRRKADDLRAVIAAYGFTEHSEQRKKLEMQAREWDVMADRIESLMNAEPVAWLADEGTNGGILCGAYEDAAKYGVEPTPLYAAPQPSECAALREALDAEQRHSEIMRERLRKAETENTDLRDKADHLEDALDDCDSHRDEILERLRKVEKKRDNLDEQAARYFGLLRATGDELDQLRERLRKAEAELERYKADEWQLVPVEPTTKMVKAFYRECERPLSTERWESPFSNGYEAMLKAAKGDAV